MDWTVQLQLSFASKLKAKSFVHVKFPAVLLIKSHQSLGLVCWLVAVVSFA